MLRNKQQTHITNQKTAGFQTPRDWLRSATNCIYDTSISPWIVVAVPLGEKYKEICSWGLPLLL